MFALGSNNNMTSFVNANSTNTNQDGKLAFSFGKCKICSDIATGIHYGVATCEGCKGFYKRSISKNENYVCFYKDNCVISKNSRNRCKSCRFKKCVAEGMSIDSIRMGRIPKLDKLKTLNSDSSEASNEDTNRQNHLVNIQSSDLAGYSEFVKWMDVQIEEANKINENTGYIYLSLNSEMAEDCISNLSSHLNIGTILNQHVVFDSSEILANTSLREDNFVVFISFLKNSAFQVYKQYMGKSFLVNNTNERLVDKNYIDSNTMVDLKIVWNSFMESIAEHTRWTTKFVKDLPGFNKFSNQDLTIIIQNSVLNLFSLQISSFYRGNENYTILKNDIQYSRSRMLGLFGPILTNLLFKMNHSFNKLNLNDYELALFYTFIISRINAQDIESKQCLMQLRNFYTKAIIYEFELNARDETFLKNLTEYFKLFHVFEMNKHMYQPVDMTL